MHESVWHVKWEQLVDLDLEWLAVVPDSVDRLSNIEEECAYGNGTRLVQAFLICSVRWWTWKGQESFGLKPNCSIGMLWEKTWFFNRLGITRSQNFPRLPRRLMGRKLDWTSFQISGKEQLKRSTLNMAANTQTIGLGSFYKT